MHVSTLQRILVRVNVFPIRAISGRHGANVALLGTAGHASHTFWVVMTIVDGVLVIVAAVLAYRARLTGREDRRRRYTTAIWGFFALGSLCLARVALSA